MKRKVTIKDVAEAAGVCKATVSYVLNDRKDQKISEETKKKVWQVVNMLGYRPNAFAQNMRVKNERLMVGVCLPSDLSVLERAHCIDFLNALVSVLRESHANAVLLDGTPERISMTDAIVAFSLPRETFFAIGEHNFIPLLSVDCRIDDALFFEVSLDFAAWQKKATERLGKDFCYVCIPPRDKTLRKEIESAFSDVLFVRGLSDLKRAEDKKIFVTQKTLADIFSAQNATMYFPEEIDSLKAQTVAKCIDLALSHEPCERHVFQI